MHLYALTLAACLIGALPRATAAADSPVDVVVSYELAPTRTVEFFVQVENRSSRPFAFRLMDAPWSVHALKVLVHRLSGQPEVLRAAGPIADYQRITVTLQPGERRKERIPLGLTVHGLSEAVSQSDLLVFWYWSIPAQDGTTYVTPLHGSLYVPRQ